MQLRAGVLLVFATGCELLFPAQGQPPDAGPGGDGPGVTADAGRFGRDVPHVLPADERTGLGDVILDGVVIDTSSGMVTPVTPDVEMALVVQDGTEPPLAILYANEVDVVDVRVVGDRPLVILARRITVSGSLDAKANGATPGPGGGLGPGTGAVGDFVGIDDAGAGGGGFGTAGGSGGSTGPTATCGAAAIVGGQPGAPHGMADLEVLAGGGSGGAGHEMAACAGPAGGGGGGAVQLSAVDSIAFGPSAVIDVGGGGGSGGGDCDLNNNASSGAGGGSGGAIFLDAPMLELDGTLVANGGGGGAGGCGIGGDGGPGADGGPGGPATGGAPPGAPCAQTQGRGGSGAIGTVNAMAGSIIGCGNGGGGGGGVGRIVYRRQMETGSATASPDAFVIAL